MALVLSSLSLTVLLWGDVCMQKGKGGRPPTSPGSGKQLQGTRYSAGGPLPSNLMCLLRAGTRPAVHKYKQQTTTKERLLGYKPHVESKEIPGVS